MKKSHILILFFIAVCISVLASQLGSVSSYKTLMDAQQNQGEEIRIKGMLAAGKPIEFDPLKDPNSFSFYLQDEKGDVSKVVCNEELPRDFEKLDEIVLTGSMNGETFYATDMLIKCPSKYVEDEVEKAEM